MNDLTKREISRRAPKSGAGECGFSLIEVLIAMAVLLIAVAGLLPLFSRSILENLEGKESTISTNHGRTDLETHKQLSFNNWEMDVAVGSNERVTDSEWTQVTPNQIGDERWVPTAGAGEFVPWTRSTRVRQFSINGVADTDLDGVIDLIQGLEDNDFDGEFDNLLPGGTTPGAIHLKEVQVEIQGAKQWSQSGAAAQNTMRSIKAF
jgi:prepilin-type N-terminal cleavage/methylation domain-containing protein